jgi:hypothetical protein
MPSIGSIRSWAIAFALGALISGSTSCGGSEDATRPPAIFGDAGCMTCVGAPVPTWQLADFQPKSPGYGKTYGLEAFKGKVTVVALLASW